MKKVFQLKWADKTIHKHMAIAQRALRKVAIDLRHLKGNSPQWQEHATQADGAANIMQNWQEQIRSDEQ